MSSIKTYQHLPLFLKDSNKQIEVSLVSRSKGYNDSAQREVHP